MKSRNIFILISIILIILFVSKYVTYPKYYINKIQKNEKNIENIQTETNEKNEIKVIRAPEMPSKYKEVIPFEGFSYDKMWTDSELLPRQMTLTDHKNVMGVIKQTVKLLGLLDIEFFLSAGTGIGSMRNWDLSPWDGDIDFTVKNSDRKRLLEALNNKTIMSELGLEYFIQSSNILAAVDFYKLYFNNSRIVDDRISQKENIKYRWPFVDIFFSVQDDTYVWYYNDRKKFSPLNTVYPLKLRPFGQFWLPLSNKPEVYLMKVYGDYREFCKGPIWNYGMAQPMKSPTYECSKLKDAYNFVTRVCDGGKCIETLKRGSKVLGVIEFDDK